MEPFSWTLVKARRERSSSLLHLLQRFIDRGIRMNICGRVHGHLAKHNPGIIQPLGFRELKTGQQILGFGVQLAKAAGNSVDSQRLFEKSVGNGGGNGVGVWVLMTSDLYRIFFHKHTP